MSNLVMVTVPFHRRARVSITGNKLLVVASKRLRVSVRFQFHIFYHCTKNIFSHIKSNNISLLLSVCKATSRRLVTKYLKVYPKLTNNTDKETYSNFKNMCSISQSNLLFRSKLLICKDMAVSIVMKSFPQFLLELLVTRCE